MYSPVVKYREVKNGLVEWLIKEGTAIEKDVYRVSYEKCKIFLAHKYQIPIECAMVMLTNMALQGILEIKKGKYNTFYITIGETNGKRQ